MIQRIHARVLIESRHAIGAFHLFVDLRSLRGFISANVVPIMDHRIDRSGAVLAAQCD
jgi:hypothetical protein